MFNIRWIFSRPWHCWGRYTILQKRVQDTDGRRYYLVGGWGGILPRKSFKIEILENGSSGNPNPFPKLVYGLMFHIFNFGGSTEAPAQKIPLPRTTARHWFYLYSYNFSCSCDFAELLDSAGQRIEVLRGYKPLYTVRVDGNKTDLVKIRFNSDSSVRRKGFLAQYKIITCK